MKVFNLEEGWPTVSEAGKMLAEIIKTQKSQEKVIKIIHGYGSSGVGGAIKVRVRNSLKKRVKTGEIKAYIPGEAFASMFGFDDIIRQYKHLLVNDSDYKKGNDGITYIIF